ncbi:leukocyte elastase inhibitor A-like [Mytilus californianus]|uniref:leukocyte elastase inhibitor A-like n=1 Tax=Mytilus californianus TaxID=6549 RepID=UPI0022468086|nr:leukocyte elastase inhibitor A-like [Mytilus californianus]
MALARGLVSNIAFEQAIGNFAFSLYNKVPKDGNEVLSPYSITTALLMLMLGTDGTTKNQMMSSMYLHTLPTNVHFNYKRLELKLTRKAKKGASLLVANRLYGSNAFSSYKDKVRRYYGSAMKLMDFTGQREKSRKSINDWIAGKTNNKIKNVIKKKMIDASTALVLVNAIYFKGSWDAKFDQTKTKRETFRVSQHVRKQVYMMNAIYNVKSGRNTALNCKILQLHYSGKRLSMIFILPNDANGLKKLESKLSLNTFKNILGGLRTQKTVIKVPKFKIETGYDLIPILKARGMTNIFNRRLANFKNMANVNRSLYVSTAVHKAFIEVNEEGTEAPRSTVVLPKRGGKKDFFQFTANHPFIFAIRDNLTGTIIFMGRVVNP